MRHSLFFLRLWMAVAAGLLMAACASMGRPQGGPRDVDPPVYVRSNPLSGSVHFSGNRIVIDFDENVQLDNPLEKVVVSPAQKKAPSVSSNGRRVTVELRDSLLPNTTYTIDFTDAIKDLNEGNVLDGFAIDFATGPEIDTLRISGMVFQASNLEPAQGILVGAYLDRTDSAIVTAPFDRVTKTNQLGQFTLRNLKPGAYRVYALRDNNRDYMWDRTEDVAFLDSLVTPRTERIMVSDTLRNLRTGAIDSIVSHPATRFLPNDLILTWFNENYLAQYLKEYTRPDRKQLQFTLGAPTDTLPSFRLLNGPRAGQPIARWAVLEASSALDSLHYWISDPAVVAQDSLLIEAVYQRVDSAESLVWKTDTLRLNMRQTKQKPEKKKDGEAADSVPPMEFISLTFGPGQVVDLDRPMTLKAPTPIASIDSSGVRLEMLVDTLWTLQEPPRFIHPGPHTPLDLRADYKWRQGAKYRLTVDSAAIVDIYGLHNRPFTQDFTTRTQADYSSLWFNIVGPDSTMVVQLLNSSDAVVASAPVVDGHAALEYIAPGTYYARLFIDTNADGVWTTGRLLDSIQPEEVYYYPRPLVLKKNWDVEQTWSIYDTPLDLQKPTPIKKNKPKLQPGQQPEKPLDGLEEDDEDVDGIPNPNYNPFDPKSKKTLDPYNSNTRLR